MFSAFSFVTVWALLWALMLATCTFAALRGSRAEKLGGALIFGVCVGTAVIEALVVAASESVNLRHVLIIRLVSDGSLALGLLLLALRFTHLWLGGALLAQASIFALQASYFVLERPHDALYAATNNVALTVLLFALGLGAWSEQQNSRAELTDDAQTTVLPA